MVHQIEYVDYVPEFGIYRSVPIGRFDGGRLNAELKHSRPCFST